MLASERAEEDNSFPSRCAEKGDPDGECWTLARLLARQEDYLQTPLSYLRSYRGAILYDSANPSESQPSQRLRVPAFADRQRLISRHTVVPRIAQPGPGPQMSIRNPEEFAATLQRWSPV